MTTAFERATPVLPALDVAASIRWWVDVCGFTEEFRHGEPVGYAGLSRDGVFLHLARVDGEALARTVGNQTMLRFTVRGLDELYADYQARGGAVHPNGPLRAQPWGGRAFDAIDPCGVCVSFTGE